MKTLIAIFLLITTTFLISAATNPNLLKSFDSSFELVEVKGGVRIEPVEVDQPCYYSLMRCVGLQGGLWFQVPGYYNIPSGSTNRTYLFTQDPYEAATFRLDRHLKKLDEPGPYPPFDKPKPPKGGFTRPERATANG